MVNLIQQPFRLADLIPQPRIYPHQLKSIGLEAIRSVWRVNQYVFIQQQQERPRGGDVPENVFGQC